MFGVTCVLQIQTVIIEQTFDASVFDHMTASTPMMGTESISCGISQSILMASNAKVLATQTSHNIDENIFPISNGNLSRPRAS